MPALKKIDDSVIGGTVIQEGQCRVTCTQVTEIDWAIERLLTPVHSKHI